MSKEEDFFRTEPTPRSSWRWAVLMGANSRTYKFPFGAALFEHAATGREDVPLADLASSYALAVARRVTDAPQVSQSTSISAEDFLTVAKEEAEESLRQGAPTERLQRAAMKSMPAMVMQKFHNIRGGEIPHQFYELRGRGPGRFVWLAPELRDIAASEQAAGLLGELNARWSIVETSYLSGVGSNVLDSGLSVDLRHEMLVDKRRRRSVAGIHPAIIGFQHGRCMLCDEVIVPQDDVVIEHTFPFALMDRFNTRQTWPALDLDTVWNLGPAHKACNDRKNFRPPTILEMERLIQRNEAIMYSPHPLAQALRRTLDNGGRPYTGENAWADYVHDVHAFFFA